MKNLKVNLNALEQLFPFLLITDEAGQVLHLGRSLKKLTQEFKTPNTFDSWFEIVKPKAKTFTEIVSGGANELVVIKIRNIEAKLTGQPIFLPDEKKILFAMNLVVLEAEELTKLRLDFNDFAVQDSIFDFLILLQTQRMAIKHADELNKKLVEANQIANKASETKSQFLANMSHEIRTPLNGLLGMASILQDTQLDDDQRDYVNTLVSSGESMLALINDILDLSKIEAGHISLDLQPTSMLNVVQDIATTLSPIVTKKQLLLKIYMDPQIPEFLCADAIRLRQILLNITSNAVKFTEKGGVSFSANVLKKSDQNVRLRFTISDTGLGMSPETLSRIFSPFVQGDSSMTKRFEGTGLGLSICKKLAEAMEGKIQAESEIGVGSKFTIDLNFSLANQ